jgi:hypothetical protein
MKNANEKNSALIRVIAGRDQIGACDSLAD